MCISSHLQLNHPRIIQCAVDLPVVALLCLPMVLAAASQILVATSLEVLCLYLCHCLCCRCLYHLSDCSVGQLRRACMGNHRLCYCIFHTGTSTDMHHAALVLRQLRHTPEEEVRAWHRIVFQSCVFAGLQDEPCTSPTGRRKSAFAVVFRVRQLRDRLGKHL